MLAMAIFRLLYGSRPAVRRAWHAPLSPTAVVVARGSGGWLARRISTGSPSYIRGPDEPPLLPHTIPEHFATIVSKYGDRPAVMCRGPTMADLLPSTGLSQKPETAALTYGDLDAMSNKLAHSLRSLGVKKGDRVAVSLGNVLENVTLTYAIFKLGAIFVPLNPTFNKEQLSAALSHLAVEVLIIGAVTDLAYKPCGGRSNLTLLQSLIPNMTSKIESPIVPSLKTVIMLDNTIHHPKAEFPVQNFKSLTPYSDLLSSSPRPVTPDAPLSADETINIQFTSGTTSMPKAAMLSHTSVLNNGFLIATRMGLEPADRIVVPPPLFHCFGSVLGLMATATTGAAIIFPSPAFDPGASLKMVAEQKGTGLYGVATMFVAELELLANPSFRDQIPSDAFSQLKKGIAAGSSVPESLMRRLYDNLGLQDLVICYGMTETSPVSLMTSPHDPFKKRTQTVGKAMPHTTVKVVNPADRNEIIPVGQKGELAVSGYLVMKGYWNDEARTNEDRVTDEDGIVWMHTGDEAAMDEDGYVEITGRIKDLIIRGGENIHPLEVENCIFQCPGVREVSVVGVPDERYGEVVGAFVVSHEDWKVGDVGDVQGRVLAKEDVREWVRKQLSGHLVPRYVWWIDEYPKTASGKIQKFKLREMAAVKSREEGAAR